MQGRIDEPRDVRRLRLRLDGADLPAEELDWSRADAPTANVIEIVDPQSLQPGPRDANVERVSEAAEPLIESDAPEIRAEAEQAVRGAYRRSRAARSG